MKNMRWPSEVVILASRARGEMAIARHQRARAGCAAIKRRVWRKSAVPAWYRSGAVVKGGELGHCGVAWWGGEAMSSSSYRIDAAHLQHVYRGRVQRIP